MEGGHVKRKTVLLPIEVPEGKFCWGYDSKAGYHSICEHFDNEGGHSTCSFGFGPLKYSDNEGGIRKPKECLNLMNITTLIK